MARFARRLTGTVVAATVLVVGALALEPSPPDLGSGGRVATWAIENEAATHRYSDERAARIGRSFDAVHALRGSFPGQADELRRDNPDLQRFVYLNGVYAQSGQQSAYPPSWYARDAVGAKVRNDWGLWLMDPRAPGWVADRVATCRRFLDDSGFDGCFLDNLGPGAIWPPSLSGVPVDPTTGRPWTAAGWLDATSQLAATIREATAPAPLAGNGLGSGTAYVDPDAPTRRLLEVLDVAVAETWIRPAGAPVDRARPAAAWRADLEMLRDATARDRILHVVVKVWTAASAADVARWHEYALATFLLGDDGHHRFTFSPSRDADPTEAHPWWDVDLGPSVGRYRSEGALYRRDFVDGLVLANPGDDPVTVTLVRPYVGLDGAPVAGSVTLAPHTGRVLRAARGT